MKQTGRDITKPLCGMEWGDCFALNGNGRCEALEDTDFRRGTCPFYKPVDQEMMECAASLEQLKEGGREDLVKKYGMEKQKTK